MIRPHHERDPLLTGGLLPPFLRATLERQTDNLVDELYDMTPDEIAIVEGFWQSPDRGTEGHR